MGDMFQAAALGADLKGMIAVYVDSRKKAQGVRFQHLPWRLLYVSLMRLQSAATYHGGGKRRICGVGRTNHGRQPDFECAKSPTDARTHAGQGTASITSPDELAANMSSVDTSVQRLLELLIDRFHAHKQQSPHPIVLGITGLQGSGKSTWAGKIVEHLSARYNLSAITVSLDDFYHDHDNLIARRDQDPGNKLYRTRGQPGTHDQQLAQHTLQALRLWDEKSSKGVDIPVFDKSRFNGEGDRAPPSTWPHCSSKPDVVVFEGWCVGFRSLSSVELSFKHSAAISSPSDTNPDSIMTLSDHSLSHLEVVNDYLTEYNNTFMGPQHFDFFVHLDTEDLRNVYRWRLQQEHAMWKAKGSGMSDESVRAFVRGYMPAYELYLEGLREGFFGKGSGKHVRVVMNREREVEKIEIM